MIAGLFVLAGAFIAPTYLSAAQTDIIGPDGSAAFGKAVAVLPNGNIVVTDPEGSNENQGAVYLYSPTGDLISTLTGGHPNDYIGIRGITVLANGNYVISSPLWNLAAGAVTWGDADTGVGVAGVVSSANCAGGGA